jgi:hypothetical protein
MVQNGQVSASAFFHGRDFSLRLMAGWRLRNSKKYLAPVSLAGSHEARLNGRTIASHVTIKEGENAEMQETKEAANGAASAAAETIEKVKDFGRDAIESGYENARDYASKGLDYANEVSDELTEFAKRQPWLAVAGAFALGYVAAKTLRSLSAAK